jgi:hypothetical protein
VVLGADALTLAGMAISWRTLRHLRRSTQNDPARALRPSNRLPAG